MILFLTLSFEWPLHYISLIVQDSMLKKMNLALEQDEKPSFLLSLNQLDALLQRVNLFLMFALKWNYLIGNW